MRTHQGKLRRHRTRAAIATVAAGSGLAALTLVAPLATASSTTSFSVARSSSVAGLDQGISGVVRAASTAANRLPARVDCRRAKCIALTFDDGPGPYTDQVRTTLQRQGARATFFLIGNKVGANSGTVRRLSQAGMEIGDHTWSHPQLTRLSRSRQAWQVNSAANAIWRVTGKRPNLLRPPYGSFNANTRTLGMAIVNWNVDTEDWRNRSSVITTRRALAGARPGAIILMHDIHPSTARALPGIIASLKARGYTLVTVSELIGAPQAGRVYYSR